MAWRDELRPASFRGVPFFIETSQLNTGRRVTVHEYPDRDVPYPEDMGKIGNSFPLTGYLLGDDYFDQKKALREAVEQEGEGELIHPYWGTLKVKVGPVSFDEDKKEGGICKVTFQFYEAGSNKFPMPLENKVASLFDRTKNALDKAKKEFDSKFNVVKMAGYGVDRARAGVRKAADLYKSATAGATGVAGDIANLAYSIRNLKAEANDLLQAPSKLSQRMIDSLGLLEAAVNAPEGRYKAYAALFVYGSDEPSIIATTPMRARDAENKKQFDNFQIRAGIIGAINQLPDMDFESTEQAVETRDELLTLIEKQLLETEDDEVYSAFQELQAQLVKFLPDQDSNLPNIEEVTVETSTNSLVFSYEKFGNVNLEEELVLRNNLPHPGFIIGGTKLELLNE